MAVLAVHQPTLAVATWAPVAAAGGGDSFVNDGYTFLYIKNASGAPITVTVDAPGTTGPDQANAFDPDLVKSIPAGGERTIGPFVDKARFNDVNGRVNLSYSGVTTLTVLPVRVY